MNETEQYIYDTIKTCIWSGFYSVTDVHQVIDDILEDDADEALLRSKIDPEFAAKAAAEQTWEEETDCDRLDQVFEALNSHGIIALQNAGYTMSDGFDDVGEVLQRIGRQNARGYCFYHGQDLERAVEGGGLFLAFGDLDARDEQKVAIGRVVRATLEDHGFSVAWDDKPGARIYIPGFDWKRRGIRD